MSAGSSAEQQAQRLSALASSYAEEAARATDEAGRYAAAAVAERQLATRLSPLTAHGYYLLADRKWPGSRSAQIDLVVVGPSGVWIIDSKHWNDFSVAAGAIFRGQADVTDEVLRLADVANSTESALAEVGLAPGEVRVALVMHGHKGRLGEVGPIEVVGEVDVHKHIAARGRRLTPAQVERVLLAAMQYFPAYSGPQIDQVHTVVPEPTLQELPNHALNDGELLSEAEILEALSAAELAAPVEDWMTFLHPTQANLVRRSFNGPSRIRGSAGTGKTVVGLHRAAYLARMHPHGRILFTTFVKTLPAVMSNLLSRLAPEAAERVDFMGVNSFASRVLTERGIRLKIDSRRAGMLLKNAWFGLDETARTRLMTRAPIAGFEYWKEEVDSVIKGRGLVSFEQYADCARPGRLVPLNVEDRRAVWVLFESYETLMRAEGIHDFKDQILLAEKALRERPLTAYAAAVVDEAQDLSLSMVRMLHSLVGDSPDAFTLIGDGQQSIYPGGYVLSEAGISLSGRGVVLDRNYRNTLEIQEFASTFIANNEFADIDDAPSVASGRSRARSGSETTIAGSELHRNSVNATGRHGAAPVSATFPSTDAHDAAMIAHIRDAVSLEESAIGDIAILCDTNRQVDTARRLLSAAGLKSMSLMDYVGLPTEAVKVGTINRAKGLEFKLVMLPWTPKIPKTADDERMARELRERYVAATRARDALWVGFC
tara:strand:+ start:146 stop:2287 length:2142 start_codon:yes stop_codon:yes gene_type:complete